MTYFFELEPDWFVLEHEIDQRELISVSLLVQPLLKHVCVLLLLAKFFGVIQNAKSRQQDEEAKS